LVKDAISEPFYNKSVNITCDIMEAYCVKCKQKREMKNATEVTMKNGRKATTGTCSVCGTKMFKINGK
jgi:RNase P subunit RPR2